MTQHVARFERVSEGAPKSTDLEFAGVRLMESVMCPLFGFRKMLQIHSDCFRVHSCDLITSYIKQYYQDITSISRDHQKFSHTRHPGLSPIARQCGILWHSRVRSEAFMSEEMQRR